MKSAKHPLSYLGKHNTTAVRSASNIKTVRFGAIMMSIVAMWLAPSLVLGQGVYGPYSNRVPPPAYPAWGFGAPNATTYTPQTNVSPRMLPPADATAQIVLDMMGTTGHVTQTVPPSQVYMWQTPTGNVTWTQGMPHPPLPGKWVFPGPHAWEQPPRPRVQYTPSYNYFNHYQTPNAALGGVGPLGTGIPTGTGHPGTVTHVNPLNATFGPTGNLTHTQAGVIHHGHSQFNNPISGTFAPSGSTLQQGYHQHGTPIRH